MFYTTKKYVQNFMLKNHAQKLCLDYADYVLKSKLKKLFKYYKTL